MKPLILPRKQTAALVMATFALFAGACSTRYQPKGLTGGYSDFRLDANTYRVVFEGNGYTPRYQVENYVLYRCAELTAQAGYDYFVTINADTEARQAVFTTPGSYSSTTTGYVNSYGNMASGSANTVARFHPGQTIVATRYGAVTLIKMFNGEKPGDNPHAFNAREVLKYLGAQVTPDQTGQPSSSTTMLSTESRAPQNVPTTPTRLPDERPSTPQSVQTVTRYATLRHTKGPAVTIPPQTLRAEYVDSGEGYGPARVITPGNQILTGEYRTISSGQNFKGLIKATLLDPDKVAIPKASLRGFATFRGSDGVVMECVYAVTSPTGEGLGSCLDNRRNYYELSF